MTFCPIYPKHLTAEFTRVSVTAQLVHLLKHPANSGPVALSDEGLEDDNASNEN